MEQQRTKLHTGELETAVMDVLWDLGGWRTAREVHSVLSARRSLHYTTINTILVRLCRKGLLQRARDGRAFAYRPSHSRAERAAWSMERALVGAADRATVFTYFVRDLESADRAQLRRALQRVADT